MSKLTDTAPQRIFLQVSDEEGDEDCVFSDLQRDGAEVTWCDASMVCCEVEYVRADVARDEVAALTAEREDWARRFILDGRTPWEWENLCKRAEAERDALRQDAQRYRWLRQNPWWLGWEHDMQAEKIDAALDDDIARAALEGK